MLPCCQKLLSDLQYCVAGSSLHHGRDDGIFLVLIGTYWNTVLLLVTSSV
jgi:hypothetical protein